MNHATRNARHEVYSSTRRSGRGTPRNEASRDQRPDEDLEGVPQRHTDPTHGRCAHTRTCDTTCVSQMSEVHAKCRCATEMDASTFCVCACGMNERHVENDGKKMPETTSTNVKQRSNRAGADHARAHVHVAGRRSHEDVKMLTFTGCGTTLESHRTERLQMLSSASS